MRSYRNLLITLGAVVLVLSLVIVGLQSGAAAGSSARSDTSASQDAYLPLVRNDPTPTPAGPAGTWQGTTSQGLSIFFTATNSAITYLEVDYEVGDCPFTDTFETTYPITNNRFSIHEQWTSKTYTNIDGLFSSSTTASGTLKVADCGKSASLTWNATTTGLSQLPST